MNDRWVVLAIVAGLAVTAAVAVAQAGPRVERVPLEANRAAVGGTASFAGRTLSLELRGLAPRAHLAAAVQLLACATHGYGHAPAGTAVADASGRARWKAPTRLAESALDGRHVVSVASAGRIVACASIPPAHPSARPAPSRHWGIWSFTRRFLD